MFCLFILLNEYFIINPIIRNTNIIAIIIAIIGNLYDISMPSEKALYVYPRGLSEEVAILVSDKFIEKLDYKQNIMYVMSNNTNALSEEINNLKKSIPIIKDLKP